MPNISINRKWCCDDGTKFDTTLSYNFTGPDLDDDKIAKIERHANETFARMGWRPETRQSTHWYAAGLIVGGMIFGASLTSILMF